MAHSKFQQPVLFISHGTVYEAFKNETLKNDFLRIKQQHLPHRPDAIIVFSGHWQTETITITTGKTIGTLEEGFPPEYNPHLERPGNPDLSARIIALLQQNNITVTKNPTRGLDHGAFIPLMLLFPDENIPVIQVSQQSNLNPEFHKQLGEILKPLRSENILFIGSGGLVHNRGEIEKFGGQVIPPDSWAKTFDTYITNQVTLNTSLPVVDKVIDAYQHEFFQRAHPTSEHFLPLVFISALGGAPTKIYEAFQWKNLSMSAFKFE